MHVSRILIYPVKSLDGLELSQAEVTSMGALRHDREWALVDSQGHFVNAKRCPRIHLIRCKFSSDVRQISLFAPGSTNLTVALADTMKLEEWFSSALGESLRLIRDSTQGFPDDLEANGPTVIGESTLAEVGSWFGLDLDQTRRRFRTNLEISGGPPFWEDRLFSVAGETVPFRLGDIRMEGIKPCQRCPVPSRNPLTGDPTPQFQKLFSDHRLEALPVWSERSRFNHFYRLAVNTRITAGEMGKRLSLGAPVVLDRQAA